jgi:hypothetical protein
MGTHGSEDGSEPREGLTAEDAGRRIDSLQHVYDEGYISRTALEAMVRRIKARVKRSADPASKHRLHSPK